MFVCSYETKLKLKTITEFSQKTDIFWVWKVCIDHHSRQPSVLGKDKRCAGYEAGSWAHGLNFVLAFQHFQTDNMIKKQDFLIKPRFVEVTHQLTSIYNACSVSLWFRESVFYIYGSTLDLAVTLPWMTVDSIFLKAPSTWRCEDISSHEKKEVLQSCMILHQSSADKNNLSAIRNMNSTIYWVSGPPVVKNQCVRTKLQMVSGRGLEFHKDPNLEVLINV